MSSPENPEKVMTVMEHLKELRDGILISLLAFVLCTVFAFLFSDRIIAVFITPFASVSSQVNNTLVVGNITEGFTTQIRIAVIAGFIFSLPVHMFNLVRFVFPGLERKTRRIILGFVLASFALIALGAYIAYFRVLPAAVNFLTDPYFVPKGVGFLLNYQQNVYFVFSFILWSVAAFQTPIILDLLLMFNVVKRKAVLGAWRFVIVGIFIVAAIITPSPDFVSQLGVGLPMTILFFLAILVAKVFKWGED